MIATVPMRHGARGFSLLEVLLAIILLALLIAGAYSGIHAAANAMRAGEAAIDRADRLRTAQEFLRHQLSRILPLTFAQKEDGTTYVFEGKRDFMRFVAPMPGYLSRGGPYVQTLELARGTDGLQLRFVDTMLNGFDVDKSRNSDVERSEMEPVVLFDHIRDGSFQYQTLDEQGKLAGWSSDWPDASVTPLMVRIQLSMQPGIQMPWPVLDVPLMLNAGAVRALPVRRTVIRPGAQG